MGEGVHERFGGPHAEALALERAGPLARGATAYVSLEPCGHQGKTPPCADALVEAGVARVVYWAEEPGAEEGGGGDRLRSGGVRVEGPFGMSHEWQAENPAFFHRRSDRPFVAVKLALSVDGGLAPPGGRRHWLTGPEARDEVHRLRAGFDAIMVGAGTWRADDPKLTVRGSVRPLQAPLRILLDGRGDMASDAAVFQDPGPVLIAAGSEACDGLRERLGASAEVLPLGQGPGGLDLEGLLAVLARRDVGSLLCEGGGRLVASLLAHDAVDRLYLFHTPRVLGPGRVPAFPGPTGAWGPEVGSDAGPTEPQGEASEGPAVTRWRRVLPPQTFGQDVLITLDRSD